ncbi:MAG TPA: bifunctional (p)ppGpp synthetase/guanosine-3',5'-bis(diphosphate) 3'-pyrophosphohydrolase [Bacillota bacterium]|nr:bifunctional (p)ppGpp synthetase/guanosine-3',5'-bis(diphosphate) 3'-pyrophosphohydrolase [Bacillota bacterium]
MITWQELKSALAVYLLPDQIRLIEEAYSAAEQAHAGQKRISGDPYIIHPLSVAYILAESKLDTVSIAAALLHDTVEDTDLSIADLQKKFGPEIAQIVDGVTKLDKLDFSNLLEHQTENYRKLFLAMAKDMRVILIKLADRLHNMRTLKVRTLAKQQSIAKETMDIYAPLAGRLGINSIKWELEDLSFRYLKPEMYYKTAEFVSKKREQREEEVQQAVLLLRECLAAEGLQGEVTGRPKHLYSIYRKMEEKQLDFSEVYDVMAIRVLVNTDRECYDVLGLVHAEWRPIPGRFKDYIAMPKSNNYQSLHTTVVLEASEPLEIQIRTYKMHDIAEYGVAAHWIYKEKDKPKNTDDIEKMKWLHQLVDLQNQPSEAAEYLQQLQKNFLIDEVFVFTPKGDLFEMPADATPVDFAYRVHTNIGHHCVGAKINGRMVQLNTTLENGDIVEIITSKQSVGPSRDWLNFIKTASARSRIRQWFKRLNKDESILKGSELLEREFHKELKKTDMPQVESWKSLPFALILEEFNYPNLEDLLAAIGYTDVSPQVIVHRLLEEMRKKLPEKPLLNTKELLDSVMIDSRKKDSAGIIIDDIDNIAVKLARCCNPIPGDPIIGYVTRGRGVSIHHRDCANVEALKGEGRLLPAKWGTKNLGPFIVPLTVTALDHDGLLQQLLLAMSEVKASLIQVKARSNKSGLAVVDLYVEVRDIEHMNIIRDRLSKVPDVYHVEHLTHKKVSKGE